MGQSTSATNSEKSPSKTTEQRRRTIFSTFTRNRSNTNLQTRVEQPVRRRTIIQQIKRIANKDSDDSDEENEEVDERVYSLPMEFIQYRRGWFERHEEYAQQFDQKNSLLLSQKSGINSDIIPIILSFLTVNDCCNFAVTCKLIHHYWLGEPWYWFKISPKRVIITVQKYQPFSIDFVNAKDWRDLAMIFAFKKTWRSIDATFEICKSNSSKTPKEESFFYFKNPDDEQVVRQLLFGKDGKSMKVKCKKNNAKYLLNFGKSIDDYKPEHGSKTQSVLFINLSTSNGSRELLCFEKFSKHYSRHDFLIVVYYWPKVIGQEKDFSFNTELNRWRNQSELNFTPYLEYLEPIRNEEEALSFFHLVMKWRGFKYYLKYEEHSPMDKHRGTLENMVLSYCSDYM